MKKTQSPFFSTANPLAMKYKKHFAIPCGKGHKKSCVVLFFKTPRTKSSGYPYIKNIVRSIIPEQAHCKLASLMPCGWQTVSSARSGAPQSSSFPQLPSLSFLTYLGYFATVEVGEGKQQVFQRNQNLLQFHMQFFKSFSCISLLKSSNKFSNPISSPISVTELVNSS